MAASDNAQSFIGSFVSLTAKSEDRYEGFLCYNQESTIGLRDARYYGTEGRRTDGPQIPPSNRVYPWLYFQRSEIKNLEPLSAPDVNRTADLLDDPAFIQAHIPHPSDASMRIAPTTLESWMASSPPPYGFPRLPKAHLSSPPPKPATEAPCISPNHIPYIALNAFPLSSTVLPDSSKITAVPPVIGPSQTSSESGRSIAGRSSVFVSDEVLMERLLKLHELLKAKILGPGSSDSRNAQGPGC